MIQFLCINKKIIQKMSSLSKNLNGIGLYAPKMRLKRLLVRVPLHVLKKGSMTVEAAIILPIFLMMSICMASIINLFPDTVKKMTELRNLCEESALFYSGEAELIYELYEYESFTPLFAPSAFIKADILCAGRVRGWNGRISEDYYSAASKKNEYVYIAETGSVYHTDPSCTHISLSIKTVTKAAAEGMRNEYKEKYKPCERCIEASAIPGIVYITDSGNRFHGISTCSGLKRTIVMVDINDTDKRKCSRCSLKE